MSKQSTNIEIAHWHYGVLGAALAFVGIPLYVHLPNFYHQAYGLSLTALGSILLFVRLIDCFQDPLIGYLSAKYQAPKAWIGISSLIMLVGFYGLFACDINALSEQAKTWWLVGFVIVTFSAFSCIQINYLALTDSDKQSGNEQAIAWREGLMITGILAASIIPTLDQFGQNPAQRFFVLFCVFSVILLLGITLLFNWIANRNQYEAVGYRDGYIKLFKHPFCQKIFLFYFFNSLAPSITATLYLFYVQDILQHEKIAGPLLGLYFLAGGLSIALWRKLIAHYGYIQTMLVSIIISVIVFTNILFIGSGDILHYTITVTLTGIMLGADILIPITLFAEGLNKAKLNHQTAFSLWNFIYKFNLAFSVGICLPLLAYFGYEPGTVVSENGHTAFIFIYAIIPCFLKLVAFYLLFKNRRFYETHLQA